MKKEKKLIQPIILGKIGSCYGIHGWLKIFSFTENPVNIFHYRSWFIKKQNQWKEIHLVHWRYCNRNMIVKLKDIHDCNMARLLTNYEITVDSSQLPALPRDNYYWKDLIYFQVINIKGCNLGSIINIIETGSNDVLVVKSLQKNNTNFKKILIPFLKDQVIKKIDLSSRIIEVDWKHDF